MVLADGKRMKLEAPVRHARRHSKQVLPNGLERSATVLLLVDFINPLEFPEAGALAPAAVAAAKQASRLKAQLAGTGVQAIYANDNYGTWHSNFHETWRHCRSLKGASRQLALALAPEAHDLAILKPRHSAFFCTPLELLLGQLRTKRLVIAGLATDMCVMFTAMDAFLRGYKLWVPADCVAAESSEASQDALAYMARVLKARIDPSTRPPPGFAATA
jgi:nicotinamidase-related amidase